MISMETLKKTIQISSLAKAKDLARAEAAMATTRRFFVLDAGGSIAEFYDKHSISQMARVLACCIGGAAAVLGKGGLRFWWEALPISGGESPWNLHPVCH